jgi:tetratricopeptide (TPR) repeat protein
MIIPSRTLPGLVLASALLAGPAAGQPPTADQQAAQLLATGRKAYADHNPQFAAEKFREFLGKFGGHKDANAARYGLGLALLDLPERDYTKALEALGPPANEANFPDRPLAVYYTATCHRGLGLKELEQAGGNPQKQQAAAGRFTEAAKVFAQSRELFAKQPDAAAWAARARCDQAEMELRTGKTKEARATAEPFAKEAALAKDPARPLGLYYHGFACFLLNDVSAAGRSLNQLAPFEQPFGPHARYLMGRVHQQSGENAEAAAAFDAVIATYLKQKAAAVEALKQPDKFKADPWEKARLEALVRNPPPDYVAGAAFYGACLHYEAGKFGEALAKFQAFGKEFAQSPLKDDAQLRAGFCLVQTKQFDEAVRTLQPLAQQSPRLSDQAYYWLGKAQVGQALNAPADNPNARVAAFQTAIGSLRSAASKANELAATDPAAKARKADILLELADAQLQAKQPREAAGTYDAITNEKLLPNKADEVLQRSIAALHLAGDFTQSENRVAQFKQQFPQSPLLPLVLFRSAENAYAKAVEQQKGNAAAAKAGFAQAAKKYDEVVAKFPEFDRASRCRYGQALCLVAAEDYEKAAEVLEKIPAPDRHGDLATAGYVLADCLIRTAPMKADDALADNMLREKLGNAAALLEAFAAANPKAPEAADALLKLGYCHKRLGIQLADPKEKGEAFQRARQTFEKLTQQYPKSSEAGAAALERAKVMALQGDKGGATNALRVFQNDGNLKQTPAAPLAAVALATLLREQNQAAEAVKVLAAARKEYEGKIAADPQRAEWVHLLRYHHGVALFESGKPGEARAAFDQVVSGAHAKPIAAEAALKACQCQADEAKKEVEAVAKELQKPNLKPEEHKAIEAKVKAAKGKLAGVAKQFEARAAEFQKDQPQSEARARMLYDAAWTHKAAGDDPVPAYTKLLAEFPDLALAVEARLELAELLTDKGKADDAVKLLREAIDKETTDKPTPPETLERVRLRLGAALFAKKDYAAAQGQFDAVAQNAKSPHVGQAIYRGAECLLAQGKAQEAAEKLKVFRDNGAFHNIGGVSDRALLRLGFALLELKQWEPARQAFETVPARFGNNNPWATDARYGAAWALQNQGRYDEAVNAYTQVAQQTRDERAGKAHLQIGLCRAAQKRYEEAGKAFAAVYYGYDLPDLKFAGLVGHARVLLEQKQPEQAAKLLDRVAKDAPKDSEWAKAAAELLAKIKK